MMWVGLTGGIASGKSTVAEILKKNGYPVINADQWAHQALRPDSPVVGAVIKAFGDAILDESRAVDRAKLGAIVFTDESKRKLLESIVHPFVKQKVLEARRELIEQGYEVAFYDVPLLFEAKLEKDFDRIILVYCPENLQLERLMRRNNLTQEAAEARLRVQIPMAEKRKSADIVIDNSGAREELEPAVDKALELLEEA